MSATKQYREWHPYQPFLFPPSPHDWLAEDDLAYFILDVVRVLDLSAIEDAIHAKDARGTRPYHPQMMTALLLYGYCVGVVSSRKIEKATYRDVAFRVIAGGNHPHPTRISEFRREHLSALEGLFVQTVVLAQKVGLVTLGRVGLDGTKVKANASKHKAMSYERMLKAEAELREEIQQLLLLAEQTDQEEDARYGKDKCGEEHLVIVSCAATNQPPDQQHLPPLVEQIRKNLGVYPDKLLADAGYWDEDHVRFCEQRGIDPYIATGRLKRGESPRGGHPPPIRGRHPKDLDAKGRMYRKLRTKRGREEYARRKVIPEPVFGQIRVGQGFQHFLLRGIDKVQAEWSLVCACHNLLKIFRVTGAGPA